MVGTQSERLLHVAVPAGHFDTIGALALRRLPNRASLSDQLGKLAEELLGNGREVELVRSIVRALEVVRQLVRKGKVPRDEGVAPITALDMRVICSQLIPFRESLLQAV